MLQDGRGLREQALPFLCRAQGQGEQQPALLPEHQASPSQLASSSW